MESGLPEGVTHHVPPAGRYGLRVTMLIVAFVLVTVPFSFLVFEVLAKGPITRMDSSVANWINGWVHGHPLLVSTLQVISLFGVPLWLGILVTAGSLYAWWRGRLRLAVFLVVTVVGGSLVDTFVKILVNRPRPLVDHPIDTALGKSFPSGHAMASTLTYGALLLVFLPVLQRRWRHVAVGAALVIVLAIGSSRLLLGVHFVSDVLGGYILGAAWLLAATAAFEIWRTDEGKRPAHVLEEGVEPEAGPDLRGDDTLSHAR